MYLLVYHFGIGGRTRQGLDAGDVDSAQVFDFSESSQRLDEGVQAATGKAVEGHYC